MQVQVQSVGVWVQVREGAGALGEGCNRYELKSATNNCYHIPLLLEKQLLSGIVLRLHLLLWLLFVLGSGQKIISSMYREKSCGGALLTVAHVL